MSFEQQQNGIGRCPTAGDGVNNWINRRVLQLIRSGKNNQEIREIVVVETVHCGRNTLQDIQHSIETGREYLNVSDLGGITTGIESKFPSIDPHYQALVLDNDANHELEPHNIQWWMNKSTLITPIDALKILFQGEKLCVGGERYEAEIAQNYGFNHKRLQYIVPSPALGLSAKNKEGKWSVRCLNNISERWYLVIEFDDPNLTLDQQAAIHAYLDVNFQSLSDGESALVMLVYSGNKSLHGWYDVYGVDQGDLRHMFNHACKLGADPHTWVRCQYVRIPGGTNRKTGKSQGLVYFNGAWWN